MTAIFCEDCAHRNVPPGCEEKPYLWLCRKFPKTEGYGTISKEIGWIDRAEFGFGGYQDAQIGLSLSFDMDGSGVGTFEGWWAMEPSNNSQWNVDDQIECLGKTVLKLGKILRESQKQEVHELVGVPVELTFDGNLLKDWRILTEVIRK